MMLYSHNNLSQCHEEGHWGTNRALGISCDLIYFFTYIILYVHNGKGMGAPDKISLGRCSVMIVLDLLFG